MDELGNILIAGGASGLGAATVRAVRRAGGTPLVIDIAEPDHDGGEVAYRRADLADTAAVENAVAELAGVAGQPLRGVFTRRASTAAVGWITSRPKTGSGCCMSICWAPRR